MPKQRKQKVVKSKKQKSDKGLGLGQLIKTTRRFAYIHEKARDVRLYQPRRELTDDGNIRITATAKSRKSRENPQPQKHVCYIEGVNDRSKLSSPKAMVRVSCDCEFFTYTCEVALFRYGAAEVLYSNGEFPFSTNPRGTPILCKHLLNLANAIKKKGY
ncbi:hypothetical protein GR11A_00149 [Vibrio phage vB_VcorM_GR11A]|nr:hypothetical protein GR11A_00149 [Vibrio phage vB_VcorM_GR11A]